MGVVEPARVSFRVSLKADGTWSSWRPTPDTGELDYPNDAREIQHRIAAAPRWAHLGLAIQLTVERNARPRRCSALSSWFTRLVRSAISLFKAIIPPRATTLSSATTKEPSPLTIARPLVAEAGATKSINEAKESRLVVFQDTLLQFLTRR